MQRAIIHVDMDAFYASVAQRDDPSLRGRPVVVGGGGPRGVVAAASYEARRFGVRSAMPGRRARELCPELIFVPVDMGRYREISGQVFELFRELSPVVEGLSLDEAFIDVSERVAEGDGLETLGRGLKQRIARVTGLTASVGMAHNKMLAKLASDHDKPDGCVLVRPEGVRRFLDPLPVRRLWGVGAQTAARLRAVGLLTIGQVRRAPSGILQQVVGSRAAELQQLAQGHDARPVSTARAVKSISQETTFDVDHHELAVLEPVLVEQARAIAARMQRKGLSARTVTIKIRSGGFSTVTRSETAPKPLAEPEAIATMAVELLRHWAALRPGFAVRLIGVGVSGLEAA